MALPTTVEGEKVVKPNPSQCFAAFPKMLSFPTDGITVNIVLDAKC